MKQVFSVLIMAFVLTGCNEQKPGKYPLEKWLPSPELVMHEKSKMGLTNNQEEIIRQYYQAHKIVYDSLKREAGNKTQELSGIVEKYPVDPVAADKALQDLLIVEREIKLLQLKVYIFTKNQLTEEQLEILKAK